MKQSITLVQSSVMFTDQALPLDASSVDTDEWIRSLISAKPLVLRKKLTLAFPEMSHST
jgi:hypothetical protein